MYFRTKLSPPWSWCRTTVFCHTTSPPRMIYSSTSLVTTPLRRSTKSDKASSLGRASVTTCQKTRRRSHRSGRAPCPLATHKFLTCRVRQILWLEWELHLLGGIIPGYSCSSIHMHASFFSDRLLTTRWLVCQDFQFCSGQTFSHLMDLASGRSSLASDFEFGAAAIRMWHAEVMLSNPLLYAFNLAAWANFTPPPSISNDHKAVALS